MAIYVTGISYENELRSEPSSYLLGNRCDKITATIDIKIETVAVSSTSNPFITNNTDGYIGAGWQTCNAGDFADFEVGDTVIIYSKLTNSIIDTRTVIFKKSDNEIQLDANVAGTIPATDFANPFLSYYVSTPITAIRYKYNLIENSEPTNYINSLTNQLQEVIIKEKLASDTLFTDMEFTGGMEYRSGVFQIKGVSIDTTNKYVSYYQIKHTFAIENFDLQNDDNDRYANGNCLKHAYEITALYEFTNPNRLQQVVSGDAQGNVGNYDENFNNIQTAYSVSNLVYTDNTATVIDAVELTANETDFTFRINNTEDTPFSNTNTKFVVHFGNSASSSAEYTNNGLLLDQSFYNDRALVTVGGAAVNGETFGTGYQSLKEITGLFVSSSVIEVSGKIALGADILSKLPTSYKISVSIQDHALATADADKVTLLVDRDSYYVNTTDATMVVVEDIGYLTHPKTLMPDQIISNPTTFPYDEAVSFSRFYIETTGREADTIVLTTLKARIKAYNTVTQQEFSLEEWIYNMSNVQLVNGRQFINEVIQQGFKIPVTEPRKNIAIKRRSDLDDAGKVYYDFAYSFMIRWEYWQQLTGVNNDFFDTLQQYNGENQNWIRYNQVANWEVRYETEINALKNGLPQQYKESYKIEIADFESNPVFINEDITSHKKSDDSSLNGYITEYEDCYLKAVFESTGAPLSIENLQVVFFAEEFETGNINTKDRSSSAYQIEPYSLFATATSVTLSGGNTIVTAKVDIDRAKFSALSGDFTVVARLFYPITDYKQFEDGYYFEFEDGEIFEFEN